MREIKFRAWDERKKTMHYNFEFIRSGTKGNDWIIFKSGTQRLEDGKVFDNPYFQRQLKIMEYTGVKDKDEIKIYEGDIVEIDDRNIGGERYVGEVYYCTDYSLESNPCFAIWTKDGHQRMSPSAKIIGNVYQNKEVSEDGK